MKYDATVLDCLGRLYPAHDMTVDRLALDQSVLEQFTAELNHNAAVRFAPAQTLDALFYARKTGKLPRLRRKARKEGKVKNGT
ncbi:MAG: hypothetical protein WD049_08900 [Candidatus Paceibacterota bacterium]